MFDGLVTLSIVGRSVERFLVEGDSLVIVGVQLAGYSARLSVLSLDTSRTRGDPLSGSGLHEVDIVFLVRSFEMFVLASLCDI
jgi:hypothetical protein